MILPQKLDSYYSSLAFINELLSRGKRGIVFISATGDAGSGLFIEDDMDLLMESLILRNVNSNVKF